MVVQTLGQVARGSMSEIPFSISTASERAAGDADERVVNNVSGTTSEEAKEENIVNDGVLADFGCERVTVIMSRNQTLNEDKITMEHQARWGRKLGRFIGSDGRSDPQRRPALTVNPIHSSRVNLSKNSTRIEPTTLSQFE
jgi:hypothetical protein